MCLLMATTRETDSDRARRTALTADVWETVRTAREAPTPGTRRPGRRRRLLAVAVAAVGAGSVAVHDLFSTAPTQQTKRAKPRRTVRTHVPAAKRHESPKPHIRPHNRPDVPSSPVHSELKTFAWVKVAGAAGYRVAFFEPGGAILVRDTKATRLTVPGTWRYHGKRETLSPGRYRWYVWPLDAGGRPSTRAIVDSALVIGR